MVKTLLLGPTNELHHGVHGSIIDHPPAGYEYLSQPATHYFLLPKGTRLFEPLSPYRYFHLGEFLHFEEDSLAVHASRFPVLHRSAWVVDLDNFGYPFVAGRSMLNPAQRERLAAGVGLHDEAIRRMENMLFACGHPSCRAVMFHTDEALQGAREQISANGLDDVGRDFLAKSRVVYPAKAPVAKERVAAKWEALAAGRTPLTILFCGRDFDVKNGELALEVFERLLERHPGVRIVFISRVPDDRRRTLAPVLERLEFHDELPRAEVLARLEDAHVLFHPSSVESLGIIYLEAFAAGLAVVGAYGEGLRHVPEILHPDGARVVDYFEGGRTQWIQAFTSLLKALIEAPGIAREMGLYNYGLVASASGQFSFEVRHKQLDEAYRACSGESTELHLEDLPHWSDSVPFAMESEDIQWDFAEYAREIGFQGSNLAI
jgi:glycosyltransferase involved in cell wall biosynthesis